MPTRSKSKLLFAPKTACSNELRALMDRAYEAQRKQNPYLSLSDWIRQAIRDATNETLANATATNGVKPLRPTASREGGNEAWIPKVSLERADRERLAKAVLCLQALGNDVGLCAYIRMACLARARRDLLGSPRSLSPG